MMTGCRSNRREPGADFRTFLLAGTALLGVLAGLAPATAGAATLDLAGTNKTLPQAGFFGGQAYLNGATDNVTNNGAAAAILSEGGGAAGNAYGGVLTDGVSPTGLTHTGGSVLLTGANTFSGGLLITGGTVIAGASQTLGATTNSVTVSGGSLGTGATSEQLLALTVSGTGLVTVNNGGKLTAGSIAVTSATATLVDAPGGTVAGPLTNAGMVGNAGLWTGMVVANNGVIGNAAVWKGDVTVNNGAIGNVGQWTGALVRNNGNFGNNGLWTGALTNAVTGVVVTADKSVITGALVNNGRLLAYGGAFNGSIVNNGAFTAAGPGSVDPSAFGPIVAAAAAGPLIGTGSVVSNGTFTNSGTGTLTITPQATYAISGGLTNQAGGQVLNAGIVNAALANAGEVDNAATGNWTGAATNSGNIENFGTWLGALQNSTGGKVFNSGTWSGTTINAGEIDASGTFNGGITNSGSFASTGATVNGDFNNSGYLSSTSTTIAGNLTNSGVIDLTKNGSTGNTLQANQYTAVAGSKAVVNVDLSTGASGGKADQFTFSTIGGSGQTVLSLVNVGSTIGSYQNVAIVNGADPGAVFQVTQANLDQLRNGPIQYAFNSSAGTLSSFVNGGTTASPAIQVASVVTTLNSDFFQDWQPFITAPQDPDVNSVSGGPWVRGKYGKETTDQTAFVNGAGPTASRVATEFSGFQVGADAGLFNINKTGWNVIGGVTGGEVFATENEKIAGNIKGGFTIPFVGVYGALTNGPFHSDIMYRHDFYSINLNDTADGLVNKGLAANGDSVSMDAGYSFALGTFGTMGNFFIEPNASVIVSDVQINPLVFGSSVGTLKSNDVDSVLGRAGFRLGTSMVVDKLALQPFMTAAVWHEFDDNSTSTFNPAGVGATPFNLAVTRVGTFGQFGVGLNGELLGSNILGTIRADFRVGDKVDGQSVTAQLRYQF